MFRLSLSAMLLLLSSLSYGKVYQLLEVRKTSAVNEVDVYKMRDNINLKFHIASFQADDNLDQLGISPAQFHKLTFNNLKTTNFKGAPSLPFSSVIVSGHPEDINVGQSLGAKVTFSELTPAPAQREKLRCTDCEQPEFVVDWNKYEGEQEIVKKEYLGDFRGTPLTKVTVIPATFNSVDGLSIYPNAEFSVTSRNEARYFESFKDPSTLLIEGSLNKKYVIVSPQKFVQTLQPLKQWKERLGYQVTIYTLEEAGNTFENVRTFLKTKYDQQRFTYGLVVGDESTFPTEYVETSSSSYTPSDLRYWTMGGATDVIPDVMSGRMVVSTKEELANQIAKIKEYENVLYVDKSGLGRHIGLASAEGSGPSDVEYLDLMTSPLTTAFNLTTKKFLEENDDSNQTNILAELSKGAQWLNYIGHGSGNSWPSINSGEFMASNIAKMSSSVVKPIVIDVACQNGKFSKQYLGERFMNSVASDGKPTGAVAYYGGSVNISWDPPAIMAIGISKLAVSKKLKHLGEAIFAGQMYLTMNYTDAEDTKDNLEWYHLFGDPSLKLNLDQKAVTIDEIDPSDVAPIDDTPTNPSQPAVLKDMKVSQGLMSITVRDELNKRFEGAVVVFKVNGQDVIRTTDRLGMVWTIGKLHNAQFSVHYPGYKTFQSR